MAGHAHDLGAFRHGRAFADAAIFQRISERVASDGAAKVADQPLAAADYRQRLAAIEPLRRIAIARVTPG